MSHTLENEDKHVSVAIDGAEDTDEELITSGFVSLPSDVASVQNDGIYQTEPCTLTWNNVKYSANPTKKANGPPKIILNDVSGIAKPGELIALMGTSGAGKTSLLNVLAGRNISGSLNGEIMVNGKPRSRSFRKLSAYVEQDDVLYTQLTVRETFRYASLLRLPDTLTKKQKIECAEQTLQQLGLAMCADTRIGSHEQRGVSGGERKRAAIGVELLTNPSIIFLDEPTSGLDSFTAFHICETLQRIARGGRTIICTIHQPSATLFELFDKVLVLSAGRTVYFGPRSEMLGYFESIKVPKCPPFSNPADYIIELTTIDARTPGLQQRSEKKVRQLHTLYAKSSYNTKLIADLATINKSCSTLEKDQHCKFKELLHCKKQEERPTWGLRWGNEYFVLLKRSFMTLMRDKRVTVIMGMQAIIMSLLIYAVFAKIDKSQQSFQGRNGAMFFVLLSQTFSTANTAIPVFLESKSVFLRERASRSYRVSSFYLAKTISDIPLTLFYPLLFCSIIYFGIGFDRVFTKFLVFLLTVGLGVICAQSIGYFVSATAPNFTAAAAMLPVLVIIFTLFGGFYTNSNKVWAGISWVQNISFVFYAFTALMRNEYKGLTFTCDPSVDGGRCIRTGADALQVFGIADIPLWGCWLMILAISIVFRILAYLVMLFKVKPKLSF